MSHVTDVKLTIKDLDALSEAADLCGMEFLQGQKTYKWYGSWMNDFSGQTAAVTLGHDPKEFGKCEHALGVKGKKGTGTYEVGLVPSKTGEGFDLLYDAWGGSVEQAAGPQLSKLRREYAAAVTTRKANTALARKGFKVQREDLPGNRIRLKLRKR